MENSRGPPLTLLTTNRIEALRDVAPCYGLFYDIKSPIAARPQQPLAFPIFLSSTSLDFDRETASNREQPQGRIQRDREKTPTGWQIDSICIAHACVKGRDAARRNATHGSCRCVYVFAVRVDVAAHSTVLGIRS